ncbi:MULTISPECIES: RagB/SusD family nutrient uptake outer membrane protein [unclassified Saccharicrinis]|uniref:RagB/SusD family nutrient uptake outer membrane protein n=1 Tax=unclassified Saccharicrinis TaxID=2646859 RepID=UPI003D357B6F
MKSLKNIFFFGLLFVAVACSDEFLESDPVNSSTEDTFYQTDDQMYAALMAAYDPLQYCNALATFVPFGEIRSDNCKTGGGGEGDQPDMQALEAFTNTEVNYVSDGIWEKNYTGIYRANLVINASYESDEATVYKAEAKFLRAWYHFDVLRTYGPCPIIDQTTYPESEEFTRQSRDNVNAFIESDLLEAIPVLLEKSEMPDDQLGRITKAAAQALLGKVYVYWADWNSDDASLFGKAEEYLQAVINSSDYSLVADYSDLFDAHTENSSESIFEIQRSTKSGWTSWANTNGTEGNFWVQYAGPRGLNSKHPEIEAGWGFVLPQHDLMDFYLPDDTVRKRAVAYTYDELVTEENTTISDPDDYVVWDIAQYNQVDFVGYAQKKYPCWVDYEYLGSKSLNRPGNERVIRLAEVYLLLAECKLRGTGNEGEAKVLMDEVRKYHVGMNTGTYNTVDDLISNYPERFSSVLDVLWYERRAELAGEGDRWFDLVRSGRAESVMGVIYPGVDWSKHIYIPIGLTEQGNSGNTLTAYPDETYPDPI